jgi:hypothetical protein
MARLGLGALSVAVLAGGCIFPLPNPATPGVIAFFQAAHVQTTTSPLTIHFSELSVPGDAVVVGLRWQPSTAPAPEVFDAQRNSYEPALPPVNGAGTAANTASEIVYATDISVLEFPLALTVTKSDATFLEAFAVEYSGMAVTDSVDATAAVSQGTGPDMNATVTTTAARDLLVGWVVSSGQSTTPGPGFIVRDSRAGDLVEDEVAPIAGTYNVSATATEPDWIFSVAAFRASLAQ